MPAFKVLCPLLVTLLALFPVIGRAAIQQIPFQLIYTTGSAYDHGTLFDGLVQYDDAGITGGDFQLNLSNFLGIQVTMPPLYTGFIDNPTGATIENNMVVALNGTHDIGEVFYLDFERGPTFSISIGGSNAGGGLIYRAPEVPIPAAAWLFGSGLLMLVGVRSRKSSSKNQGQT